MSADVVGTVVEILVSVKSPVTSDGRMFKVTPLPFDVERPGVSAIDNMLKYQLAILDLERQWLLWPCRQSRRTPIEVTSCSGISTFSGSSFRIQR